MKLSDEEETAIQERLALGPDALHYAFFWLGAAVALRRGVPIEAVAFTSVGDGPSTDEALIQLKDAYEAMRAEGWPPEELDIEIRVTKEYLTRAGWPVNEGLLQ